MNVQECYIFVGVDTRDLSHKTEQFATSHRGAKDVLGLWSHKSGSMPLIYAAMK